MQNLYFDDPFPGISIPEIIGKDSIISTLTSEYRIIRCYFKGHGNGPIINAVNKIYKFQIDQTAFVECRSDVSGGIAYLNTDDDSHTLITRTCACFCQCGFQCEGNVAKIILKTNGKCSVSMVSMDQCEKGEKDTFHTLEISYGSQYLSNINNTNCKCFRNSGFSNINSIYGFAKYCNLVGNEMTETLLLFAYYRTVYKYFNIIGNVCSSLGSFNLALIRNYNYNNVEPYLLLESSYIYNNICEWLIQSDGTTVISGCFLDCKKVTGKKGTITNDVNVGVYRMTLLASCGLHADLPYACQISANEHCRVLQATVHLLLNAFISK